MARAVAPIEEPARQASSLPPSPPAHAGGSGRTGTRPGSMAALSLHVMGIAPPHVPSRDCPCGPLVGLHDASGDELVVHRAEGAASIDQVLAGIAQ